MQTLLSIGSKSEGKRSLPGLCTYEKNRALQIECGDAQNATDDDN